MEIAMLLPIIVILHSTGALHVPDSLAQKFDGHHSSLEPSESDEKNAKMVENWIMPALQKKGFKGSLSGNWVDLYSRIKSTSLTLKDKQELLSTCDRTDSEVLLLNTPYDVMFVNRSKTLNEYPASTLPGLCNEWWGIIFEHGTLHPKVTPSEESVRILIIVCCLLLHAFAVAACIVSAQKAQPQLVQQSTPTQSSSGEQEDEAEFGKVPGYICGLKILGVSLVAIYYSLTPFTAMIPSRFGTFNAPGHMFYLGRGLTWTGITISLAGFEVGCKLRTLDTCTWTSTRAFWRSSFWKIWPQYHIAWLFNVYSDLVRLGMVQTLLGMGKIGLVLRLLFLNFVPFQWFDTFSFGQVWSDIPNDPIFGRYVNWYFSEKHQLEFWGNAYMVAPQMFVLAIFIFTWAVAPLIHKLIRWCEKDIVFMHMPLLVSYYWGLAFPLIGYCLYLSRGEYALHSWDIYQINPFLRVGEFGVGMSTAYICQHHKKLGIKLVPDWFGEVCFLVLCLCIAFLPEYGHSMMEFGPFLIFGGLQFLMAGCFYGNEMSTGSDSLFKSIFGCPLMQACGKRSELGHLFANPAGSLIIWIFYGPMKQDDYPSMAWYHIPLYMVFLWTMCWSSGYVVDRYILGKSPESISEK